MHRIGLHHAAACLALLVAGLPARAAPVPVAIGCGDVTADAIVVWGQGSAPGALDVEVARDAAFARARRGRIELDAERDLTGQTRIAGLEAGMTFDVRLSSAGGELRGRCRTAPTADARAPVRFVVGGDVGGQGYCRHAEHGYRIFAAIRQRAPDFFIANGDLIYADGTCPAAGPDGFPNVAGDFAAVSDPAIDWTDAEAVRGAILAHWRYNRADPHLAAFYAETPVYAQWDDHEALNDFGAAWQRWPAASERAGYATLVAEARAAFLAYSPLAPADGRLYRSVRWGRELELFLIDGRSFRAPNDLPDGPAKVLLGDRQRQWLIDGLTGSRATWKVVSSNVPLAVPTGWRADRNGRDGFANGTDDDFSARTGFEHELLALLRAIEARVSNLVFVVTDVHVAASLRLSVDLDDDGVPLVFHELISGPLNAGMAPTLQQLDPTLAPVILFSEGNLFNFGEVEITPASGDTPSRLVYSVRDEHGAVRAGSRLELEARTASEHAARSDQ